MNLVLPLELSPHCAELGFCTGSRHDVVHDVDVNVVKDDHVSVAYTSSDVVNDVSKYYSILS